MGAAAARAARSARVAAARAGRLGSGFIAALNRFPIRGEASTKSREEIVNADYGHLPGKPNPPSSSGAGSMAIAWMSAPSSATARQRARSSTLRHGSGNALARPPPAAGACSSPRVRDCPLGYCIESFCVVATVHRTLGCVAQLLILLLSLL
nr:unnamed protein product [Digitaria exilis]